MSRGARGAPRRGPVERPHGGGPCQQLQEFPVEPPGDTAIQMTPQLSRALRQASADSSRLRVPAEHVWSQGPPRPSQDRETESSVVVKATKFWDSLLQ